MSDLIPDPENPSRYIVGNATDPYIGAERGVAVLKNVHSSALCAGQACVVHNPSDHHMRSWPLTWRDDKRVFERSCEHGIGHPGLRAHDERVVARHDFQQRFGGKIELQIDLGGIAKGRDAGIANFFGYKNAIHRHL